MGRQSLGMGARALGGRVLIDSYRKRIDALCGRIDVPVESDRAKCRSNGGLGGLELDH